MFKDLDRVLPSPVQRQLGPPEKPPDNFDQGYVLPTHTEKPLQTVHRHPLDERLVFYEEPHVYTFDGVPTSASVTALAHEFETEFDADGAIRLMKSSRGQVWPRLAYVVDARPLLLPDGSSSWSVQRGAIFVVNEKSVSVSQPRSMADDATVDDLTTFLSTTAIKGSDIRGDVYTFSRVMTDDEIRSHWKTNGRVASHRGTEAHWLAECFFNGVPFRWWEPEMKVVFDFCRTFMQGMVAWNTEKEIVCKDADLAGSIDLIVWDDVRRVHHIIDFKRSDKLSSQMRGYGKMRGVMSHLDDCKGAAYALQCSLYQYVLERDYGMTIGDRVLISIHPDNPFSTSVPYLAAEVDYIMKRRFCLVKARRAVQLEDPFVFSCDLTGAPLVDAVRLTDGRRAMVKAAQVSGLSFDVDSDTRSEFDSRVGRVMASLEEPCLDSSGCKSWKRIMPASGIVPFSSLAQS